MIRDNIGDRIFIAFIYVFLALLAFSTFYPFWNSLVISFNEGLDTAKGGITFWPREFTLENYRIVFEDSRLMNGFVIAALRTVIGTLSAILATSIFAYGMSKRADGPQILHDHVHYYDVFRRRAHSDLYAYPQPRLVQLILGVHYSGSDQRMEHDYIPHVLPGSRQAWRNRRRLMAAATGERSSGLCCHYPVPSWPRCRCSRPWRTGTNGSWPVSISRMKICCLSRRCCGKFCSRISPRNRWPMSI